MVNIFQLLAFVLGLIFRRLLVLIACFGMYSDVCKSWLWRYFMRPEAEGRAGQTAGQAAVSKVDRFLFSLPRYQA